MCSNFTVIIRLLALIVLLLAAAQPPMATAGERDVTEISAPMAGASNCHTPMKEPMCQVDCALCHALPSAVGPTPSTMVAYAALLPGEPCTWLNWTSEVEPPIPRLSS